MKYDGLNPCCNGRCSASYRVIVENSRVDGLNPCCNGRCSASLVEKAYEKLGREVLILVVMEDALRDQ